MAGRMLIARVYWRIPVNDFEHYRAAEQCLWDAEQAGPGGRRVYLTQRAEVHARLAAVAHAVRSGAHPTRYWLPHSEGADGWRDVLTGGESQ
jgi:hypothetical protein